MDEMAKAATRSKHISCGTIPWRDCVPVISHKVWSVRQARWEVLFPETKANKMLALLPGTAPVEDGFDSSWDRPLSSAPPVSLRGSHSPTVKTDPLDGDALCSGEPLVGGPA